MSKTSVLTVIVAAAGIAFALSNPAAAQGASGAPARACAVDLANACGAGEYCRAKPSARTGVCKRKPEICNMLYAPVCGVDAKTYPNACHAAAAGINVAGEGACRAGK